MHIPASQAEALLHWKLWVDKEDAQLCSPSPGDCWKISRFAVQKLGSCQVGEDHHGGAVIKLAATGADALQHRQLSGGRRFQDPGRLVPRVQRIVPGGIGQIKGQVLCSGVRPVRPRLQAQERLRKSFLA